MYDEEKKVEETSEEEEVHEEPVEEDSIDEDPVEEAHHEEEEIGPVEEIIPEIPEEKKKPWWKFW